MISSRSMAILVRASTGAYAAGEAPPRYCFRQRFSHVKLSRRGIAPQPSAAFFLSTPTRAALAASTSDLSCSTRADAEANGRTSLRCRMNSTRISSP